MDKQTIAVVGLGYVGLPVACAFADKYQVVGFDINASRIDELKQGVDKTEEVSKEDLNKEQLLLSSNPNDLRAANFFIIAVPTPIDAAKKPDLSILISASETVGKQLKPGDIVVFESTVFPGVSEEVCLPVLERESGLVGGVDFFIGYSPERINPGDKEHTFKKIKKIVSAQTKESLAIVSAVYGSVVEAGVYEASSIKVAEAAKVIENTQRDINIAFVNELALIFSRLGLSTHEVLEAANTKWNFLPFKPGLVGGHCIGVDPYYLTFLAEKLGYHPEVILSGRRINDRMGKHIAERTVKAMIASGKPIVRASIAILGITFKENCPDVRNTKVVDIINELSSYHINSLIFDPVCDRDEVYQSYQLELSELKDLYQTKVAIIAVAHDEFLSDEVLDYINQLDLVIDVKNSLPSDITCQRILI